MEWATERLALSFVVILSKFRRVSFTQFFSPVLKSTKIEKLSV